MKKVLVLGSTGMAGHVITSYMENQCGYEVTGLSRSNTINSRSVSLDVTNLPALDAFLQENKYDIIINSTGILNQFAERRKDLAVFINAFLPHYLEQRFTDSPTKIFQLSTDCVFSGKEGGYLEDSFKDGDTFYDRSKALGEVVNSKDLTFRMSIVGPDMSKDGIGLFNWFMNSRGKIKGYLNAIWTGVTTIELAKAINAAIEQELTGLYHLVPNESISKHDLLKIFQTVFNRQDIEIEPFNNDLLDKSLVNTRTDFCYQVPGYIQMVEEMKIWIDQHKNLYKHYFSKE